MIVTVIVVCASCIRYDIYIYNAERFLSYRGEDF